MKADFTKPDPSAFDYVRKKFNPKRHWPKHLLAVVVGVLVAIVFHQNKQSSLVEREARCADIQQAAKIVKLNYLLGKEKEDSLYSLPIFPENQSTYFKTVETIYSQEYQPHPVIKEALTDLIVGETYFDCIREHVPEIGEHLDDN